MGGQIRLRLLLMRMIMMMDATEEKGSAEDRSMRADGIIQTTKSLDFGSDAHDSIESERCAVSGTASQRERERWRNVTLSDQEFYSVAISNRGSNGNMREGCCWYYNLWNVRRGGDSVCPFRRAQDMSEQCFIGERAGAVSALFSCWYLTYSGAEDDKEGCSVNYSRTEDRSVRLTRWASWGFRSRSMARN